MVYKENAYWHLTSPQKDGTAVTPLTEYTTVLKHMFSGHSEVNYRRAPKVDLLHDKIHKEVICSINDIATYL